VRTVSAKRNRFRAVQTARGTKVPEFDGLGPRLQQGQTRVQGEVSLFGRIKRPDTQS
jgi:hypothetical protein